MDAALRDLLDRQDGTATRRQLIDELGLRDHDVDRWCRRRELVRAEPGVYVDHTGPLTWAQRSWVAVHACWPAALANRSALPSPMAQRDPLIHVVVDRKRTLRPPTGVRVHRTGHLGERVEWHRSPPRQRLPEATLDAVAAEGPVAARFRLLADVLQTRRTTVDQLQRALAGRARISRRSELAAMLADLATGAGSVLEREYLRLEAVHGLPTAHRQGAAVLPTGRVYRDAGYPAFGLVVELDGRAFHDSAAMRDRDLQRDLDTRLAENVLTVRLGYAQVFDRGCTTIAQVAALLSRRGWTGTLLRCPGCV